MQHCHVQDSSLFKHNWSIKMKVPYFFAAFLGSKRPFFKFMFVNLILLGCLANQVALAETKADAGKKQNAESVHTPKRTLTVEDWRRIAK